MKRLLLICIVVLLVLAASFIAVFGLHRGRTHAIRDRYFRVVPGSIAWLGKVRLGGAQQWVLIRGWNRRDPVVLFIHGGPGAPVMYLAHRFQRKLEHEFVMVHWDQRGAGKSFDAGDPADSLNVRRTLNDVYELTRWLRAKFHQDRIYIIGHSWGSMIGMLAIKEHPEYYRGYIGVGQMAADSAREVAVQRQWLMKVAFETNDRELFDRLHNFGDITEKDIFKHRGQLHTHKSFLPLLASSFRAPEYTWRDVLNIRRGAAFVQENMQQNVLHGSVQANIRSVSVPVFFFLGAHDYLTPSMLAVQYLRSLNAPLKRVVWFPDCAHYPFFENSRRFTREMHNVRLLTDRYWDAVREPKSIAGAAAHD